jgi:hypothetical protein
MTDQHQILSETLPARLRGAISLAWSLFSRKVGGEFVEVNKEASMQLQFAYILQQLLPLITFRGDERLRVELETDAKFPSYNCEIDVLLSGESDAGSHRIAIEMKCYKTKASSGGNRGATDIFMKDVYEDLAILEQYVEHGHADEGIALVMTDLQRLVSPKRKDGKAWQHYDVSHGATFGPASLTTPIGGKEVRIELKRKYVLEWIQYGSFWFLAVQGEA